MGKVFGSSHGFSLLELLFTLIIIAILMGIALPAYNQILLHARRVDGKIGLLQLAAHLEQEKAGTPAFSPEGFYKLVIIENNPARYIIAAYPIKSQSNDKVCGALALNSLGQKGVLHGNKVIPNASCW